ncbi:protein VASCULAR ASSOCIATED DEATH 1, chloroplastic-like [Impatiens glandulifera]|uniref:protein VASCULAR ASSOCIATED DEATH 1, chloroplastic-like n=1 Tax=Impatiens glandulifera TaxID=253017 RepID=UPI001FB0CA01|nr:protein VASCULAR ASSOCIATED DEATH 1, chloroplastic-like [Impatiens glandulifera]
MAVISAKIESSPSKFLSKEATRSSSPSVSTVADQNNTSSSSSTNESTTSNDLLHDSEIQPYPQARSEEYRHLFRLPDEEVLIQDFNCALQENFFLQGHLYLFNHNVCFYSNIFGYETKRVIPFNKITSVQRAKAAGLFPTAIEIMVGEKKLFFTSFLSRDDAFKLITEGWSQHGKPENMTTDILDKQSNLCNQKNGADVIENFEKSECLEDEMEGSKRHKDVSSLDDSSPPQDGEPECIPMSPEVENTGGDTSEAIENSGSSPSSVMTLGWTNANSEAPKVSEDFTKVAEEKFQISVKEFFNLFCSDEAVGFLESFHRKCGDKDFKCSSWYQRDEFYHARDKSFLHPIKIYFGAKSSFCQEFQTFRVFKDNHLVIETSQVVKDVPYADYFTVEGRWDVKQDSKSIDSCFLTVYMRVSFSKRTVWKVKIVQSTLDECRDVYALWIKSAHELLMKKHLENKEAGDSSADTTLNDDGQSHQGKVGNSLEPSESTEGTCKQQTTTPDIGDTSPLRESDDHSIGPTVREPILKSLLFLNFRNKVPIMVMITFAMILVLMQLSIVVLLSRPQQVQVIHHHHHQSDYSINKLLSTDSETREQQMTTWLDKRIDHVNEDIGITEKLLDKIQQEHALLKTQLSDLQNLKRQLMEK